MGKGIGAIALLIGLAGPVAFAGLTYDLLRNVLGSSPVPFAVTELSQLLLAAVAGLVPLLVMTVLAGGVAWKSLQRKEETEWKELQS
jgi:ABC-type xylose transport system permease subunit